MSVHLENNELLEMVEQFSQLTVDLLGRYYDEDNEKIIYNAFLDFQKVLQDVNNGKYDNE